MNKRYKDSNSFFGDSSHYREMIKASFAEITKDFQLINNSVPVVKRVSQLEPDLKKLQKVRNYLAYSQGKIKNN